MPAGSGGGGEPEERAELTGGEECEDILAQMDRCPTEEGSV